MTFLSYFVASLALVLSPFTASLHTGLPWLSRPGAVAGVFAAGALAVALMLTALHRLRGRRVVEAAFVVAWVIVFTSFFAQHVAFVRDHVPASHRVSVVAGAVLGLVVLRLLGGSRTRVLLLSLSLAFLAADSVTWLRLGLVGLGRGAVVHASARGGAGQPHVIHVVFDMFSAEHAGRDDPRILAEARRLAERYRMTWYDQHFSTAADTGTSVPDFLREDRARAVNVAFASPDSNSLFAAFARRGYRVSIHGQSLPYCARFAPYLAGCRAKSRPEDSFAREVRQGFALVLSHINHGLPPRVFGASLPRLMYRHPLNAIEMVDDVMRDHDAAFFGNGPAYAYVHLLIPHDPFVVDEACRSEARPRWDETFMALDGEQLRAYQAQSLCALRLLDRLLGHFESLGVLDHARLLVHADHGRLRDTRPPTTGLGGLTSTDVREAALIPAWTRVPGQSTAVTVGDLTSNASASAFLLGDAGAARLPHETVAVVRFQDVDGLFFGVKLTGAVEYVTSDGRSWRSR